MLQGDTWGSILASVQVDTIGKACQDSGYGYKYKNILPISLLGLVDDMIGISEVGFKVKQMNALINVKTAEKRLQFGIKKCKTMLVGKNTENCLKSKLEVDSWKAEYKDDLTGQPLDPAMVEAARRKELEYFASKGVWQLQAR